MILALDPGIRGSGAALLDGSTVTGSVEARPDGIRHPMSVDHTTARLAKAVYLKNPDTVRLDAGAAACMAYEIWKWAGMRGFGSCNADFLAVEWPQVYQGSKQKGDPNDLLPLAGVDAALAVLFRSVPVCSYHPRGWKGQITKEVCHERIRARLTPEELAQLEADLQAVPSSLRHNVLDAVGIGLNAADRFRPGRIIARGNLVPVVSKIAPRGG